MEVSVPCTISESVTFAEGGAAKTSQAGPIEDDGQDKADDRNYQD
jgi:hypothetical protein